MSFRNSCDALFGNIHHSVANMAATYSYDFDILTVDCAILLKLPGGINEPPCNSRWGKP